MIKKTKIAAVIGSALIGVVATSSAQAGAVAQSIVLIDDFTISNSSGVMSASDFSLLEFTGTSDTAVGLTTGGTPSESATTTNGGLMDLYSSTGAGSGTPGDNAFTAVPNALGPGNFATADTYDYGSPISGLTDPNTAGTVPLFNTDGTFVPGSAVTPSATSFLGSASYVHLETNDIGSASSNNSLEAKFNIIVGEDGVLNFNFAASVFVSAFLSLDAIPDSFATAAGSITFSMIDINTGNSVLDASTSAFIPMQGFDFSFGAARASNAPGDGVAKVFGVNGVYTPLSFSTLSLAAGTEYQLTASMLTKADAKKVIPEPESLVLVGLGLLGLSLRKKTA